VLGRRCREGWLDGSWVAEGRAASKGRLPPRLAAPQDAPKFCTKGPHAWGPALRLSAEGLFGGLGFFFQGGEA